MQRSGLIRKIRLISKFMTSQPGKQTIEIHILHIEYNMRHIFLQKSYIKCGGETVPRPIVCYYHATYAFWSESKLYSCLNVKELLSRNRRDIWSLSDNNWIWNHNHLVRKRTFLLLYTLFFIRTSKFCLRLTVLIFFHFWGWNVLNLFLFPRLNLAMPQRRMSDWVL